MNKTKTNLARQEKNTRQHVAEFFDDFEEGAGDTYTFFELAAAYKKHYLKNTSGLLPLELATVCLRLHMDAASLWHPLAIGGLRARTLTPSN